MTFYCGIFCIINFEFISVFHHLIHKIRVQLKKKAFCEAMVVFLCKKILMVGGYRYLIPRCGAI